MSMDGKFPEDKPVSVKSWLLRPKITNLKYNCRYQKVKCCDLPKCAGIEGYTDCHHSKRTKLDALYSTSHSVDSKGVDIASKLDFGVESEVIDFQDVPNICNSKNLSLSGQYTNRVSQHADPTTCNSKIPCSFNLREDENSLIMPDTDIQCSLSQPNIRTPTSHLQMSYSACTFPQKTATNDYSSINTESMYQQGTSTNDPGYISQSTCSHLSPPDGPEIESSALDQDSQIDNAQDQAHENCVMGNNSVTLDYLDDQNQFENLPNQFLNFFKNRLETEMHRFWESMCDLLYEQQCHVQLIVDAAIRDFSSQNFTEMLDVSGSENNELNPEATEVSYVTPICVTDPCFPGIMSPNTSLSTGRQFDHSDKMKHLLDIMTLSCSISTLLARPQFKS